MGDKQHGQKKSGVANGEEQKGKHEILRNIKDLRFCASSPAALADLCLLSTCALPDSVHKSSLLKWQPRGEQLMYWHLACRQLAFFRFRYCTAVTA